MNKYHLFSVVCIICKHYLASKALLQTMFWNDLGGKKRLKKAGLVYGTIVSNSYLKALSPAYPNHESQRSLNNSNMKVSSYAHLIKEV